MVHKCPPLSPFVLPSVLPEQKRSLVLSKSHLVCDLSSPVLPLCTLVLPSVLPEQKRVLVLSNFWGIFPPRVLPWQTKNNF